MPEFACGLTCDRLLGEGTSGSVWAVESSIDGGSYAVKRIELADVPQTLEQALAECRLHSKLACPSVAGYQYSWVERDEQTKEPQRLCMLLERLDGELYDALLSKPPTRAEQLEWTGQLLDALAAVHTADIVHRDISPWNCFVRGEEKSRALKLGDFGLACTLLADSMLRGMECEGFPPLDASALGSLYSAPELGSEQGYGSAVDVFSVGMTLFAVWDRALDTSPASAGSSDGTMLLDISSHGTQDEVRPFVDDASGGATSSDDYEERLTSRVEALRKSGQLPDGWDGCPCARLIAQMVSHDPKVRPSAKECVVRYRRLVEAGNQGQPASGSIGRKAAAGKKTTGEKVAVSAKPPDSKGASGEAINKQLISNPRRRLAMVYGVLPRRRSNRVATDSCSKAAPGGSRLGFGTRAHVVPSAAKAPQEVTL